VTRADPTPPAATIRLSTAQAGELLTALARAANAADDRPGVVALRNVRLWLNGTAGLALAAQRRLPVRCEHCQQPIAIPDELATLVWSLAVEL
jgi:hypothetical protein